VKQNSRDDSAPGPIRVQQHEVAMTLRLVNGRWLAETFPAASEGHAVGCTDAFASSESNQLLEQTCAAAEKLFSFDYRTLDTDFAAQRAVATGPFRDEVSRVTSPAVAPLARKEHVSVTVQVSDAAIERQTPATATVLVFLNQDVKNDLVTTTRVDRNRVELTMTKVDGRWLVSGIRAL
jgi:hypothetical protein